MVDLTYIGVQKYIILVVRSGMFCTLSGNIAVLGSVGADYIRYILT